MDDEWATVFCATATETKGNMDPAMGSMIHLALGNLELDWGKNQTFTDHSPLFRPSDVKLIPYYYFDDDGSPRAETKEGYSRPLRDMLTRIELLGHTFANVRTEYAHLLALHDVDSSVL